jgi:H+-transporting ATPase
MNRLSLAGTLPEPGFTEDDVVHDGALASNEANADSIDLAFLRAARERNLMRDAGKIVSFTPFSPKTRKTEARVERDGSVWTIEKGALRTIAETAGLDAAAVAKLEARAAAGAKEGLRHRGGTL